MFIFVDSSGDWGINKGSEYTAIAAIALESEELARGLINKIRNAFFTERGIVHKGKDLCYHKLHDSCREIANKKIGASKVPLVITYGRTHGIQIDSIKLMGKHPKNIPVNKNVRSINIQLEVTKAIIRYTIAQVMATTKDKKITVICDRDLPGITKEEIRKDIEKSIPTDFIKLRVRFADSEKYCGIQLADLVAGSFIRSVTKKENYYYEYLRKQTRELPIDISEVIKNLENTK